MSTSVTWPPIGGSSYLVPNEAGEVNWTDLTDFLVALAAAQGTGNQKVGTRVATVSPVTVSSTTDYMLVTDLTAPGAVAVNLPAAVLGQAFIIKDGKGDAATNNITVNRNGSDTIDGATSVVLSGAYASVMLICTAAGKWNTYKTFVTKSDIGLGNVDNTSDATKNAAVATLTNKTLTTPVIGDASSIVAASASVPGVVTTGTQTFAGAKTFTGATTFSSTGAHSFGINTGGTLGIGNTLGYARLQVGSTNAFDANSAIMLTSNDAFQHGYIRRTGGSLALGISSTNGSLTANDGVVISSAGAVQLGTGTSSAVDHLFYGKSQLLSSTSSSGVRQIFTSGATNGRTWQIGHNFVTGGGEFSIYDLTATSERLSISTTGGVTIGNASSNGSHILQSAPTSGFIVHVRSANTNTSTDASGALAISKGSNTQTTSQIFQTFGVNGNTSNAGGIRHDGGAGPQLFSSSDRRVKKHIVPIEGALAKINALSPVSYEMKANPGNRSAGFIAQEFAEVFPEMVTKTDDGLGDELPAGVGAWSMSKDNLCIFLVAAMKEQQTLIESLKARIEALEGA